MRKDNFLFLVVGMTISVLGILTTSSCSKDVLFGIEDNPCIDSQRMHEIAESDIYINYQKEYFSMVNELSKIDTTQRGRVIINDGDTLFENETFITFEKVQLLFEELMEMYPELKDADQADLKEIQSIALSNNSSLKSIATKTSINYLNRTKGDNYGYSSQAIEWINSISAEGNSNNGSTYYGMGQNGGNYYSFELVPCASAGDAMNLAIIWSRNHENSPIAGFGWSDSGLIMYCQQSTEFCTPALPASAGNPLPLMDFILHPSGSLYPNESDIAWWSSSPEVSVHYIISSNYEFSVW